MKINNKNIIVTGASAGIGKELVAQLLQYENVKIIGVARNIEKLTPIPEKLFPYKADLSNQEGVDNLFEFAQHTFGNIDIFIANAGFGYLEEITKPDWSHIERIFSLNVFSTLYSLEKIISQPKVSQTAFISIISGAGLVSLPGYSLYCSTKAALHHFMETFRYEKGSSLDLIAVYPVATRTNFFEKAAKEENPPLPFPVQNVDTVARKIIHGIEKNKKHIYPSNLFRFFYPIGRAFPALLKADSYLEKRKVKKWLINQDNTSESSK